MHNEIMCNRLYRVIFGHVSVCGLYRIACLHPGVDTRTAHQFNYVSGQNVIEHNPDAIFSRYHPGVCQVPTQRAAHTRDGSLRAVD